MNKTILKTLSYLGAEVSLGQPHKGVERGPNILRQSGLFQCLRNIHNIQNIRDYGNVNSEQVLKNLNKRQFKKHMVRNLQELDIVLKALNTKLRELHKQRQEGNVILTVGGDHSIGCPTINAALTHNPNLKVLWVDAHADLVNPYIKGTNSHNYHGMPLSHVTGVHQLPGFEWLQQKLPFENVVMIGIRDIQDNEYLSIKKHNIKAFTMQHVIKYGIGQVMTQAIKYLDPQGNAPFHISFDLDACDPYAVSQTGTVYRDGLSHRQSCHIIRRVVNQRKLISLDIVQLNQEKGQNTLRPKFRDQQHFKDNLSETVGTAVDLVTSLCNRQLTTL